MLPSRCLPLKNWLLVAPSRLMAIFIAARAPEPLKRTRLPRWIWGPFPRRLQSQTRRLRLCLTDQLRKFIHVDVASGDDGYDLARTGTACQSSCDSAGGGPFYNDAVPLGHQFHRLGRFGQGHDQGSIQEPACAFEHVGEYHFASNTVDKRRLILDRARFARS